MGVCEIFILFVLDHDIISTYEINQSTIKKPRGGYTLSRAFTLIELLVVIAIIGILASVVIASLNSARTKGRYAAIKSNLRNAVSQAAIYHANNGTYTGLCDDSTIQSILSALGGSGSAACFAHDSFLIKDTDFGIVTVFDNRFFTAGPEGVLSLDATDSTSTNWNAGVAFCGSNGKRLPNISSLRALYSLGGNAAPATFGTYYYSSNEDLGNSANAYYINFSNGSIGSVTKTTGSGIRCGS